MITNKNWRVNDNNRKCIVGVFIFLIVLFLLRYPIIKLLSRIPEPPPIDFGQCEPSSNLKIGQVHITPSTNGDEVIFSFSSNVYAKFIALHYGPTIAMEYETFASHTDVSDTAELPYVYSSQIKILLPGQKYFYRIDCKDKASRIYHFNTWPSSNEWKPRLMFLGDAILDQGLKQTAEKSDVSLITQIGATINQTADSNPTSGEAFMKSLEGIATGIPYILVPGHAGRPSDLFYNDRFPLPGVDWPVKKDTFHTVIGPIQIIGFNSESLMEVKSQDVSYDWLNRELILAEKKRRYYPWIVLVSRKNVFCKSNGDQNDICKRFTKLIAAHKVDLYITERTSEYERTWSLLADFSTDHTYHNHGGVAVINMPSTAKIDDRSQDDWSDQVVAERLQTRDIYGILHLKSASQLCWSAIKLMSNKSVDSFCLTTDYEITPFTRSGRFFTDGNQEDYSPKVLWTLVILLSAIFTLLIVFRQTLWQRLCVYMNTGSPLPYGKQLSV